MRCATAGAEIVKLAVTTSDALGSAAAARGTTIARYGPDWHGRGRRGLENPRRLGSGAAGPMPGDGRRSRAALRWRGCSRSSASAEFAADASDLWTARPTDRDIRCRPRCTTPGSRRSVSTPSTCRSRHRDVADFRRCAEALGVAGASITTPFKLDVLPLLDEVTPLATAVGAVNTIVMRDGRLDRHQHRRRGISRAAEAADGSADARATVLGAGGAARAVAFALQQEGAQVAISARRPEAAAAAAARSGARARALAAARRIVGRAGERHAGRRTRPRRECRWTSSPRRDWSTT